MFFDQISSESIQHNKGGEMASALQRVQASL